MLSWRLAIRRLGVGVSVYSVFRKHGLSCKASFVRSFERQTDNKKGENYGIFKRNSVAHRSESKRFSG